MHTLAFFTMLGDNITARIYLPSPNHAEQGKRICDRYLAKCKELQLSHCYGVVLTTTGQAKEEAVAYAIEKAIDLVIVGHCGHKAFKRIILGSFSHYVVDHAHCDVLVVK
jgi:nucleotide-binding universal stress UspA family protein